MSFPLIRAVSGETRIHSTNARPPRHDNLQAARAFDRLGYQGHLTFSFGCRSGSRCFGCELLCLWAYGRNRALGSLLYNPNHKQPCGLYGGCRLVKLRGKPVEEGAHLHWSGFHHGSIDDNLGIHASDIGQWLGGS